VEEPRLRFHSVGGTEPDANLIALWSTYSRTVPKLMCMGSPRKRKLGWVWTVITSVLLVAGVAAVFLLPNDPIEPVATDELQDGESYYLLLSKIEVDPRQSNGDGWDSSDGAPDIFYEIRWRDTKVFESSRKDDTLVAIWSNSELGLTDLTSGISIDGSIKAARITARAGESIEFLVYDQDDLTPNDEIAQFSVAVETLRVGDTAHTSGSIRVNIRVVRIDDVKLETLTR
jgi:hypothetical protein